MADTMFFDLHKMASPVASSSDADIKAACCTAFSAATCADWTLNSCPADRVKVGTNSAPGGGSNGMTLTQSEFETSCCVAPTYTCESFTGTWVAAQLLGQGCATDTGFFDLKKSGTSVASSSTADIKAACCTPFSQALCSDWNLMTCAIGTFLVGTNAAPSETNTLTNADYRSSCCRDALECSAWTMEASSAHRVVASIIATIGATFALMWA